MVSLLIDLCWTQLSKLLCYLVAVIFIGGGRQNARRELLTFGGKTNNPSRLRLGSSASVPYRIRPRNLTTCIWYNCWTTWSPIPLKGINGFDIKFSIKLHHFSKDQGFPLIRIQRWRNSRGTTTWNSRVLIEKKNIPALYCKDS